MKHITGRRLGAACVLFAAACSSSPPEPSGPPKNQGNACAILDQRQDWGAALTRTQRKWGAPPEVVMAIIWRESSFRATARPPKRSTFWGSRHISTAYGYSQALDGTWGWYEDETGDRRNRESFHDATDFVGWYLDKTMKVNGIPKYDAFNQYLAYHEGHTGYRRGNWRRNSKLQRAASQVQNQAAIYRSQLATCRSQLA